MFNAETCSEGSFTSTRSRRDQKESGFRHRQVALAALRPEHLRLAAAAALAATTDIVVAQGHIGMLREENAERCAYAPTTSASVGGAGTARGD